MKITIIAIIVALLAFSAYKTYTAKTIDDIRQAERQQLMKVTPEKLASLQRAAESGERMAQYELGLIYARGADILPQDYAKAHDLLYKASMKGVPQAQYHLGEMYVWGDGVEVNYEKATVWFWLATSLGDRYSQKRLRAINTRISSQALADAKVEVDKLWKIIPHDLKIEKKSLH
jgi:uncharacterized protein